MTNLQAALGVAQLERLDEFVNKKRTMGRKYMELIGDMSEVQLPVPVTNYAENIYWVFGVVLGDKIPFDAVEAMRRFGEQNIGTRPFFYPMHLQPVFRNLGLFAGVSCPVAERIAERGFYLPSGLGLSDDDIVKVASTFKKVIK